MAVNKNAVLQDFTLHLRGMLASGIVDPVSGARNTYNTNTRPANLPPSKFITTSPPYRQFYPPVISVEQTSYSAESPWINSLDQEAIIGFAINVWTKNIQQRDVLAGSCLELLRVNRLGKGSGALAEDLYDFMIVNVTNLDEKTKDDRGNVHVTNRKLIEGAYKVITGV